MLEGIRVVESAAYVTGPLAAMILADLGADVIKVERPPKGDPLRRIGRRQGDTGVLFANVNRGKRSVFIDATTPEGADAYRALVAGADVLITNYRRDPVPVDHDRLIRVAITVYGPDGPLAGRPGFDSLLQAHSGLAAVQGGNGSPQLVRAIMADKVTGYTAAQAVLAALVARERTGNGRHIDLAMLDAMAYFNFPDMMTERTFPPDEPLTPPGRPAIVGTRDGYIAVAPATGAQIVRAVEAAGHPEWKAELKAITDPRELADAMLDRLETVTRDGTTAEWVERFNAHDVPAAPVLDLDGHLSDPQVVHNDVYRLLEDPHLGPMRVARHPVSRAVPDRLVPRPGEHTEEVLAELAAQTRP